MTVGESLDLTRSKRILEVDNSHKAIYGQYLTPIEIAQFMAELLNRYGPHKEEIRLLDPGAGLGILGSVFVELISQDKSIKKILFDAYEIDESLKADLRKLKSELEKDKRIKVNVLFEDFIKSVSYDLIWKVNNEYSHVIMNPPYKKLNIKSSSNKCLQDVGIETVNLYAAFVALSIKLLQPNGVAVAIIPRSFCNGLYYLPFRRYILDHCSILHIHTFKSRNAAFREESVLQENVIFVLKKNKKQPISINISYSDGYSFINRQEKRHPVKAIISSDAHRYFSIPEYISSDLYTFSLKTSLTELGLDVSTGPIVDFRMKEKLVSGINKKSIPLFYPIHFRGGALSWPIESKKPNSIQLNEEEIKKFAYRTGIYIVVKRFSSKEEKRRIWAAVLMDKSISSTHFTLENHLNIIHCKKESIDKTIAYGLFVYLNSKYLDGEFRRFSGHTQVNATDLRNIKYPNSEQLMDIGKYYLHNSNCDYDSILEKILGKNK